MLELELKRVFLLLLEVDLKRLLLLLEVDLGFKACIPITVDYCHVSEKLLLPCKRKAVDS